MAMTTERLAQILLANGVTSPRQLEEIAEYVLCPRIQPSALDCPAGSVCDALSGSGNPTGVQTPDFIGQLYHDTVADTYYRSTGTTSADWTAIAGGGPCVNQEGVGEPTAVTPDFTGQVYKDTNNGSLWRANSTTLGDWTLESQNRQYQWTPRNEDASELMPIYLDYGELAPIDILTCLQSWLSGIYISDDGPVHIEAPNLLEIDRTNTFFAGFSISSCGTLESISLPLLEQTGYGFYIDSCSNLVSISIPAFVTGNVMPLAISVCPNLSSVDVSAFVPANGETVKIMTSALNASSVNLVLARCVANAGYVTGNVLLQGGTNAAPSGQGIIDKATLVGRGVSVTTN